MPLVDGHRPVDRSARTSCSTSSTSNYTVTDNFTWQRGTHALKVGGLATFEQKNENAANQTQGNFTFGAGGGRTAFQNFLTGNADGLCGTACTYTEAQTDVTEHLRFNRYEFFAQDIVAAARQRDASTTASATRSIRRSPTPTTC